VRANCRPGNAGWQHDLSVSYANLAGRSTDVLQVIEPIFEPTFHPSSHGFRPHRGAHTAIAQAKEHLTAGYQTVVDPRRHDHIGPEPTLSLK